ncbi:CBF-domain-containing protein [Fomitiporia mediterranea MF3/22]|uniref:CBF-domain-containing protein n=1 Tax=Fomitiporia mediterranea (strain MF3/22) TaxID=694068 RepID=UPI0004408D69|nr:CBF-domain-containing protein [Fomitiporia mediterranea MF3/22]EJD02239.1 CBF-domain-containing protein [Fomitiporia mediterranea MF3/22]
MARQHAAKKAAHASTKLTKNSGLKKEGILKNAGKNSDQPPNAIGKKSARHDNLREDILALGGDDEDYDLVKDADSAEEVLNTGSGKTDSALSKDLAGFMKGLNFSHVKPSDVVEESEEEESSAEQNSEEETSSEATSDASVQIAEKREEKQKITIPKVGPNSRLLIEPTPHWYTAMPPLPPSKSTPAPLSSHVLTTKQSHASSLHTSELSAYENATSANKLTASSSDAAFLQRILSSGTLSDRLSALTLLAQSSPLYNTRALETLRGMAQKKGREESLKALRAICDWWVGGGAPDRKLKYFIDQPINHPGVTDRHLLLWHFEDWLKKYFYGILQILETLSLDPLPYVRLQAIALIFTLLRDKPEQEQNLLRLLVNKLGDSERSVASRASYHLLQLLQAHPSMKAVVVREVSSLILKPKLNSAATSATTSSGATHLKFTTETKSAPKSKTTKSNDKTEKKDLQQEHSRYYAAITLNQIMLASTEADRSIAVQLINLYFELFKEILGSPATPLDNAPDEAVEEVDHTRYGKEKRKRQERKKGKEKENGDHENGFAEVEDSNSRLISAILTGVNRALPFAKLGLENVEFSRHIDTLFLISHRSTFNISLQALRLIMQICQSLALSASPKQSKSTSSSSTHALSTSITDRYYRALYASLFDTRLSSSSKHAMYLNLLLKSLKVDTKVERVKAFVRRFVQLLVGSGNGGVEFVAGGLYLLGELFKAQPTLRNLLEEPNPDNVDSNTYDPKKRDPQYANAGTSPMWELTPLLSHYHPTIRLHTSQLLSGTQLTANADLSLNTLSHFLDRFIYKNPKKPKPKGSSAMQPGAQDDGTGMIRIIKGNQVGGEEVVNDEVFWKRDVGEVPVDQVFFHKYFSKKNEKEHAQAEKVAKRKGAAGVDDADGSDEDEDEASDRDLSKLMKSAKEISENEDDEDESEGEAEIWKAMQATNPDLHPDLNPDEDDDFSITDSNSDTGADSDSGAGSGSEAEEGADSRKAVTEEEDEDEEDALSLAESSSAEDLISLSDINLPEGLIEFNSSDDEGEDGGETGEWGGFESTQPKKRKHDKMQETDDQLNKKKKRRKLPTFATYEDYAQLIEGEPEDNI